MKGYIHWLLELKPADQKGEGALALPNEDMCMFDDQSYLMQLYTEGYRDSQIMMTTVLDLMIV